MLMLPPEASAKSLRSGDSAVLAAFGLLQLAAVQLAREGSSRHKRVLKLLTLLMCTPQKLPSPNMAAARALQASLLLAVFVGVSLALQLRSALDIQPLASLLRGRLAQQVDSFSMADGLRLSRLGRVGPDVLPEIAVGFPEYMCITGESDCGAVAVLVLGRGPSLDKPVLVQRVVQLAPDLAEFPLPPQAGARFGHSMVFIGA